LVVFSEVAIVLSSNVLEDEKANLNPNEWSAYIASPPHTNANGLRLDIVFHNGCVKFWLLQEPNAILEGGGGGRGGGLFFRWFWQIVKQEDFALMLLDDDVVALLAAVVVGVDDDDDDDVDVDVDDDVEVLDDCKGDNLLLMLSLLLVMHVVVVAIVSVIMISIVVNYRCPHSLLQ